MPQLPAKTSRQRILIVDDHEAILNATIATLKQQYPDAEIYTAQTAQIAIEQVKLTQPDLMVVDLSMPDTVGDAARIEHGIQLLKTLMEQYPTLNIVVQSAHVRSLVRLKPMINQHEGGFTIVDKSLPMKEMLTKAEWALQGLIYTPKEMRSGLELKPEWMDVLQLAFREGLQDKAIAERMKVAERTVRHYWTKIQDALAVYPDEGKKNVRIQTEIRAREEGLID
ncbi:MAG: response regulator transcription factor [Leptolyngbyaceae cyanobacterium bins.349]|nr:response regulator transcription factor [Leptolyngbyaceae cyanobacterium bins.349]